MNFQNTTKRFISASLALVSGAVLMSCNADDRMINPRSGLETVDLVTPGTSPVKASSMKVSNINASSTKASSTKTTNGIKANYLMGKFNPAKSPLFTKIPQKYANRSGMYLRKEALDAFIKMHAAAKRSGVHLTIRSATRNFNYQKNIWERKWLGKRRLSDGTNVATDIADPTQKALRILEYSAMPGTSRHHWGSDIDLNAFNNRWFESGKGLKLFNWMTANAATFGFCRPYTAGRAHGYKEEKWHWSYKPLSKPMLEAVPKALNDRYISGFLGSATATRIGVVDKYILGVNARCK